MDDAGAFDIVSHQRLTHNLCQMVGATIMGIHLVLIFGDSTTGTEMTSGDRDSVDRLTPYEKGRRKVSNVTAI